MENTERYRIPLERLKKACNLDKELDFCSSTREVAPFDGVIGQERAVRSMQFGLDMDAPGYNIFVVGPNGTGRSSYANAIVARTAVDGDEPDDWCYLNNFANEDQPWAVSLPPGWGKIFQKDMDELVTDLKVALPKAFEENSYVQRKTAIITTLQQNMESLYRAIDEEARTEGFTMRQIPPRFMFMPIKDGQPMPPEDFEKLTPEERQSLDERGRKLTKRLDETLRTGQTLEKDARTQMEELEKQVAFSSAGPLVGRLNDKYADYPRIVEYLDSALKDIVEKHTLFVVPETPEAKNPMMPQMPQGPETDPYIRYRVNVLVNNEKCTGQPVVIEPTPNYYNLFGKIEYNSQMFSMSTDFTMIRPGALHKANGGFLILQAKDILTDAYVWETLKKALKHGKAVVENIGEQYRLVPTGTIKPEPIPLNVKVIMISNPQIYDILYTLDEDFQKLFKVRVDFDIEMPRNMANICQYASFVTFVCRRDNLKDFSRSGLGKVIEYGSRLAGNQNKLSTRFNDVTETIYEAAALAEYEGSEYVEASHVSKAIEERKYRAHRIEEKIQEQIIEKKMLISTE
ncbi:MAG TPA: ATP-binding protein, partial [Clostridiaceae bacterium]|nr:ATP-binding protein [Clostridiaceae bacterium]